MLGHRLRFWLSIITTLGECAVFSGQKCECPEGSLICLGAVPQWSKHRPDFCTVLPPSFARHLPSVENLSFDVIEIAQMSTERITDKTID